MSNQHHLVKSWMVTPYLAMLVGWIWLRSPWLSVLLFHGGMLAALCVHRKRWDRFRLWKGGRLIFWIPLLLVIMLGFAAIILSQGNISGPILIKNAAPFGLDHPYLYILSIYFCLVNPVLEEAFWRGLFGSRSMRPILSDMAYGGYHFFIAWPFVPAPFALAAAVLLMVMGYVWRQVAQRIGGLRIPIIWHALGDIALVVGGYLSV